MNDFACSIVGAVAATAKTLPPVKALGYEYVVAANGLFIRAESRYLRACVPVHPFLGEPLKGLENVAPYASLVNLPRIPISLLWHALGDARARLPNEAAYLFVPVQRGGDMGWQCVFPEQKATRLSVEYEDNPASVVDLHSHNTMDAFFSPQDNRDQQGLRLYCVIGRVDTAQPELACRVGVYGHFMDVPMGDVFETGVDTPIIDTWKRL